MLSGRRKRLLVGAGGVVLSALIVSMFVPLFEYHWRYCFYCGRTFRVQKVCGVTWLAEEIEPQAPAGEGPVLEHRPACGPSISAPLPPHDHVMIESAGGRTWLFHGGEHWDEFCLTGGVVWAGLERALAAKPEKTTEIIANYMALVPRDEASYAAFGRKWLAEGAGRAKDAGEGQ